MRSSIIAIICIWASCAWGNGFIYHHDLTVKLLPETHEIEVTDILDCRFPNKKASLELALNGNMKISSISPDWQMEKIGEANPDQFGINTYFPGIGKMLPIHRYRLSNNLKEIDRARITINYRGKIFLVPKSRGEEYSRSFRESPGIIFDDGVYLNAASFWYVRSAEQLVRFRVTVHAPDGWYVISQGQESMQKNAQIWDCKYPMDEIYLVGGPLVRYRTQAGRVNALVYLRQKDPQLAQRYLTATGQYLEMYTKLLGAYPYTKFALIENFWESGYGMPSFTLLGSKIIRFPFIIRSSYPHEILHNWWGNSVFVDYQKGNWCEGLTAYMADHLMKEQNGQGAVYRRRTLQKYRNFAIAGQDFPLRKFRTRHSGATEAVGYGKSLMFFHELRMLIGDQNFINGLRKFYKEYRFQTATFDDMEKTFSTVSGKDLNKFFYDRIERTGAPTLILTKVRNDFVAGQNFLQFTLSQKCDGKTYSLNVPVIITFEKRDAIWTNVPVDKEEMQISLTLPDKPVRVDIDPSFDLFRKVDRSEIPPSIGQIFGSAKLWKIPGGKRLAHYQKLAKNWKPGKGIVHEIKVDSELEKLPVGSVWFFGRENVFSDRLIKWFSLHGVRFDSKSVTIQGKTFDLDKHCVVLSATHPEDIEQAIGWIIGGQVESFMPLARKLPHYGKYSYLVFEGKEAVNVMKGQWPIIESTMTRILSKEYVAMGKVPKRPPLALLPSVINKKRLRSHLMELSDPKYKGRMPGSPELDKAAQYIADHFAEAGLKPLGKSGYFQTWHDKIGPDNSKAKLKNVVAFLPGSKKHLGDAPVIIGAHYDHLGTGWPDARKGNAGKIHPGADDNASGIAVLLELAYIFGKRPAFARPIIFVAFTAEEAGRIGSRYFVSTLSQKQKDKAIGMINLDSVGRLGKKNLLILGAKSAREWPYIAYGCGYYAGLQTTAVTQDLDSSDHISFLEAKIPSIQLFSGPHLDYHSPGDTVDKIDFVGMAKITSFSKELLSYLADREQPLNSSLSQKTTRPVQPGQKKRNSLGSIPDFSYRGEGVRLSGVVEKSPLSKAKLMKGDILIALGKFPVKKLTDLAQALRYYKAGDKIVVKYLRKGKPKQVEVILEER